MYKLLILLTLSMLMGCSAEEQLSKTDQHQAAAYPEIDASIEWFGGTMEEAFALAESTDKPLFLYWGAVWCPPCQEIKHTVFKSQTFINLTAAFIPVYLDGDTDRAQSWGEKFGVKGYPTMIVFNPQGKEVTRIPGGIDVSRYNGVLELSLNEMRPTSELIEMALDDPDLLKDSDFFQLAFYSWGQDTSAVPEGTNEAELFYLLSNKAPDEELSSRFYMAYVNAMVSANEESIDQTEGVTLPEGDRVFDRLKSILSSNELTLACWDTLAYTAEEIVSLPVFTQTERDELETLWADQLFSLRFAESLSKTEKLAGWFPSLYLLTKDEQSLSTELQDQLRQEMQKVDAATPDSYERMTVINQISHVYREANLDKDAQLLLLAELDKSVSPYYFMSGLASLAEKDEKFEEAVDWRRKAYEHSVGEATRFQWGTSYVLAMIRMSSEEETTINTQAIELLAAFSDSSELFSGRNFRTLRRLNKNLQKWQLPQGSVATAFHEQIKAFCAVQIEESTESQNCRSLFVEDTLVQAS